MPINLGTIQNVPRGVLPLLLPTLPLGSLKNHFILSRSLPKLFLVKVLKGFAFLKGLNSFSEITKDSKVAKKMEELYQDISNIDLWVGGLAEDHEGGSELGPTFRT